MIKTNINKTVLGLGVAMTVWCAPGEGMAEVCYCSVTVPHIHSMGVLSDLSFDYTTDLKESDCTKSCADTGPAKIAVAGPQSKSKKHSKSKAR